MSHKLSADEYEALEQMSKLPKGSKPSHCINRNAKRLAGIKLFTWRKDGSLEISEAGRQMLFLKQCIDGLRAIANNPASPLAEPVVFFLAKKGHILIDAASGQVEITTRGRESLADIESHA